MKKDVSIIIVNYKSKKYLFDCISSIYSSKPKLSFEIIVVDNGGVNLKKYLLEKFPKVIYIKSDKNLGFGAGNNLGAKFAKGQYFFFLNPDTLVFPKTIDYLYDFFKKNKKTGIVSPLVLDNDNKTFKLQAYKELTPLNSIISFSFLKNLLWKKSFFEKYSLSDWENKPIREVDSVYGAALMTSKEVFNKVNGFDEAFFLYFEENDISKRVKELNYKLYINSNSKITHKVGQSTKQYSKRDEVFANSRFLYLKKHHGLIRATIVDLILKINKTFTLITVFVGISLYLRIFNISQSMQFIGDQGWFYISARDLLINGKIPLVGITSSHIWLHQGPLWTYMLAAALFISKFNPVGGAYLTAFIGVLTMFLIYKLGTKMFSQRIGVIASVLYAVCPLIVFWERYPFDPSVIPFFTVLYLFSLYKWLKGSPRYLPVILFLIAILYNLELATFTLFFPFALIVVYGFWKNKTWTKDLKNFKFVFSSVLIGAVPMIPVIVYDFSHGFKQTIVFLGWTFYKPFSFLLHGSTVGSSNLSNIIPFLLTNLQKLIFSSNLYISLIIFILSLGYLIYVTVKNKKTQNTILLLFLVTAVSGVVINQTPSDAYLPIVFPFLILLLAVFFDFLLSISKLWVILIAIIVYSNIYYNLTNYSNLDLLNRTKAVERVINLTKGQKYNLIGKGQGSQFVSFTMNYEYLLWWKNHPVSKSDEKLKIIISEDSKGIHVNKK